MSLSWKGGTTALSSWQQTRLTIERSQIRISSHPQMHIKIVKALPVSISAPKSGLKNQGSQMEGTKKS